MFFPDGYDTEVPMFKVTKPYMSDFIQIDDDLWVRRDAILAVSTAVQDELHLYDCNSTSQGHWVVPPRYVDRVLAALGIERKE